MEDLIHHWYEGLQAGREDTVAQLLAPDFVAHMTGRSADARTLGYMRAAMRVAFTDFSVEWTLLHASAEHVTVLAVTSGQHTGDFMGHPGSGRSFKAEGIDVFRMEGGRIAELWSAFDTEGMLRQLGLRGGE